MNQAKVIFNSDEECTLSSGVTTIGRATDNDISLSDDKNISRYHAEIEKRGEDYWFIDLGSSNGSKINGENVDREKLILDGDELLLGGSSKIKVILNPVNDEDEQPLVAEQKVDSKTKNPPIENETPSPEKGKFPLLLIFSGVALAIALLFVVGAALYFLTRETPKCNATAKILKPNSGDVIKTDTPVEIEISNSECVKKVRFEIEGKEFSSSEQPPFSVSINPNDFPEFGDGLNRILTAVLLDENGAVINRSDQITFFVETMQVATPTPTSNQTELATTNENPVDSKANNSGGVSIGKTVTMSSNVIKQFQGGAKYTFNPQFLTKVRQRTAEYVSPGYFARAQKYRDAINVAFIRENSLDPPLGYILAMSRSKYQPKVDKTGVGLWRLDPKIVNENAYDGLCGSETIESASQNCAAKASSIYLKDLILKVFEGDTVYGIAAFGMSPNQAEQWKRTLPANRADFWNVIKSDVQRQEVVNFFAAAIVAENPHEFGLTNDRPLSELYSVYMR